MAAPGARQVGRHGDPLHLRRNPQGWAAPEGEDDRWISLSRCGCGRDTGPAIATAGDVCRARFHGKGRRMGGEARPWAWRSDTLTDREGSGRRGGRGSGRFLFHCASGGAERERVLDCDRTSDRNWIGIATRLTDQPSNIITHRPTNHRKGKAGGGLRGVRGARGGGGVGGRRGVREPGEGGRRGHRRGDGDGRGAGGVAGGAGPARTSS